MPLQSVPGLDVNLDTAPMLAALRFRQSDIGVDAKRDICQQLRHLLTEFYVHLPQKRLSMAIDPIRELVLLEDDADLFFSDEEFLSRLLRIFKRLRDRHTTIRLPAPWNGAVAFLPLVLESCWEDGNRIMVLSKAMAASDDPMFQPGVEITHWNGTPIARFVEDFSFENEGSNPFARIAIALRALTLRPLAYSLPPAEDWVTLTYRSSQGDLRHISIAWRIWTAMQLEPASALADTQPLHAGGHVPLRGVDKGIEIVNRGLQAFYSGRQRPIFTRDRPALEMEPVAVPAGLDAVRAFHLQSPQGETLASYLRIFSFDVSDVRAWAEAMAQLLRQVSGRGLVIDVRSNPGGTIPAGEVLLQLLSRDPIEVTRNVCRATDSLRRMSETVDFMERWHRSLDLVLQTGLSFSQGFELTHLEDTQHLAGSYDGPIVVVVDALSYSTTDYFVAGFEDNKLGKVLGIDPTTGAGGANVWSLSQVAAFSAMADIQGVSSLPLGMDANVAVRRALRVGRNDGLPLEGIGANVDAIHFPTRRDLLSQNEDLLAAALDLMPG